MAAQSRKRAPFEASGPFLARRAKPVGDVVLQLGCIYAADCFPNLGARRLETLYSANWFDMATNAKADQVITRAVLLEAGMVDGLLGTPADPLDRDGDGDKGGRLSDDEAAALAADGYTVEAWLGLPESKREMVLQSAVLRAANPSPNSGTPAFAPGDVVKANSGKAAGIEATVELTDAACSRIVYVVGEGDDAREAVAVVPNSDLVLVRAANEQPPAAEPAETAPETAPVAQEGPSEVPAQPETAAEAPAAPETAPEADTTVIAYKHFGFGKWHGVNAAGDKLGDPMSKTAAAAAATDAKVPVLGANDPLPTTEA